MGKIVTAEEVRRRAGLGDSVIELGEGVIVTPSAVDEAAELGVQLARSGVVEGMTTPPSAPARRRPSGGEGSTRRRGPGPESEPGNRRTPVIPTSAVGGDRRTQRATAHHMGLTGNSVPRVAVMGGGHGGLATAAHLTLKGFPVTLFSFFESELLPVREQNGVQLTGDVQGFAEIDRVTTSIDVAIRDADIIILVYPALVHGAAASIMAGSLRDEQLILLTPSRTGGALEFARVLKRLAVRVRVYIAEAQTFMYAAEKRGPATVDIAREKRTMRVAALPAKDNDVVVGRLQRLYPQIAPAQNVFETSLNNIGPVVHPAPMLLNMAAIERAAAGEHVRHYRELITRSMCDLVLEPLDAEKVSVAKAMGLDAWTARDWYRESYGVVGDSIFEVLQKNPYYAEFAAPGHFLGYHHILDEVPNSLVPIAHLGDLMGVPTPTIRSIVDLASATCRFDFWQEGRTLTSLGIDGLAVEEMISYVEDGVLHGKSLANGLSSTRDGEVSTWLTNMEEPVGDAA